MFIQRKMNRQMRKMKNYANDLDLDDVLDLIGLERRRSALSFVLPVIGLMGAGVLIGAGIGMFFAPSSGRELRRDAGRQVNQLKDKIRHAGADVADKAENVFETKVAKSNDISTHDIG